MLAAMSETVERERLDVDLLFVGAGVATLASVIRLADLCKAQNLEMPAVLVIEKAPEIGGHQLSGAMMDPRGLAELMPDFLEQGFPFHYQCTEDYTWAMTPNRARTGATGPSSLSSKGARSGWRRRSSRRSTTKSSSSCSRSNCCSR